MLRMGEHQWEMTNQFGYATHYRCRVCKVARHYGWTPGWPGGNTYFDRRGNEVPKEPACTATPVDGLFGGR